MPTPRQLANLRPPRRGEVRNPTGRNQWTADRERRERFHAVCLVLNHCADPAIEQAIIGAIAEQVIGGAIAEDRRLLGQLFDYLVPPPAQEAQRYNRERRLVYALGSPEEARSGYFDGHSCWATDPETTPNLRMAAAGPRESARKSMA